MKKFFLNWLLITILFVTLVPSPVLGASPGSSEGVSAAISLEKAIQIVKQNFTIPGNMNEFNSSFDRYGERQRWQLCWSSQDEEAGNFAAEVDAVSGEIVSMNRWVRSENDSKTPSLSAMEARKIGQDLLARILPAKIANLTLQDDSSIIPLGSYESPRYTMNWKRKYNGINVATDYVRMEINMITGEVESYNLFWTDKDMPNPAVVISQDQARQAFISQEIVKLQYRFAQSYRPIERGQSAKAHLIYGIRHQSNGMIDAISGQPLSAGGYNRYMEGAGMYNNMKIANDSIAGAPPVLISPEEQKEIDRSAKYISQEKAIEMVKKWIPIAGKMKLESAALEKDWQNPETRCWRLSWSNDNTEQDKNSHIWAQLDAATGELLSFNLNLPPSNQISNSNIIDQKTAQILAENFIKTVQPQRWTEVKLDDLNKQIRPMDMNPPTWSFEYLRMVNGILCPENGIEVAIDAASKQVTSYRLNWSKNEFPAANGAINLKQANDIFLQTAPLILCYTMVPDSKGNEELKLVYMPEAKNGFTMIDAISGEGLDAECKAIANKPRAYVFNDIKGHFGEKEMTILGQAGIFGEYNNRFHPDEKIKLVSLLRAMLTAKEGIYSTSRMTDEEIMKRCQNLHWIEKDTPQEQSVSREFLAQLMIRYLNIDYLSQIQGIYQLSYRDAAQMSPKLKAYAALCWGLGIIRADGKTFNPQHTISRAEAAVALVHTLSIKTQP